MSIKKVPDEIVLFPEAVVEGITLKPWTFGQLLDINPFLEAIFIKLEEKGVRLDEFRIGFTEIKSIYFAAAPQLLKVLELSTGKDEAFLRGLDLTIIVKLIYVIWSQNSENLKNVSSLFNPPAIGETPEPNLSADSVK